MRKGELTTQQIVMLIVLITSFVIILFLLFRLNLGDETREELCRNSVILQGRGTLPNQKSLSCYRTYTCITQDGTCEKLTDPEIVKVKSQEEIYKELAEEMTTCWWMFGEGNVNYVGGDLLKSNYCSICYQTYLDDSLKNIEGLDKSVSKDELYEYMSKTKMPGRETTYLEYLFGTKNLNQIKQQVSSDSGIGTFGSLEFGKEYFVVMGIINDISKTEWAGTGALIGGGVIGLLSVVTGPPGWIVGGLILATTTGVAYVGGETVAETFEPEILAIPIRGKAVDNDFIAPTIVEAESSKFKILNCEEIVTFS